MTPDPILPSTEETLPAIAAGILQPEMPLHDSVPIQKEVSFYKFRCTKCDTKSAYDLSKDMCLVRNTIPLTWDNAMKWRDWAVEKYGEGFLHALCEVMINANPSWKFTSDADAKARLMSYAAAYAKPIHYIKAACLVVLSQKELTNETK